jgi:hypothetical protein
VVAPYNAQVELIGLRLAEAGFGEVPVGTVDKFQGREAAIAIVSMSASSAVDVPRGLEVGTRGLGTYSPPRTGTEPPLRGRASVVNGAIEMSSR